jgi:hypothetical protein
MAAKVNVEVLKRLQSELTELCDGLQRSYHQVTNEASQLHWNDDRFRVMLGFLDETVQTVQMAKAGIDAYLPELGRHIYLLTDY